MTQLHIATTKKTLNASMHIYIYMMISHAYMTAETIFRSSLKCRHLNAEKKQAGAELGHT